MKKTITLSKTEYDKLKRQADIYEFLAGQIFSFAIKDPIEEVVSDFEETGLYSKKFIKDLESGLRRSSYSKKL